VSLTKDTKSQPNCVQIGSTVHSPGPEGTRGSFFGDEASSGAPGYSLEDTIKTDLTEIECEGVKWIESNGGLL
jgi:hypothetical protein